MNVRGGRWIREEDRKLKLDNLRKELGFRRFEDWYSITYSEICKHGGREILKKYGHSPIKMLISLYKNHDWLVWKFEVVPKRFWDEIKNQKNFLDWLENQLGFNKLDDYYLLSNLDLRRWNGSTLLSKYNDSIPQMLSIVYPAHKWIPWKFHHVPKGFWKKSQNRRLFVEWLSETLKIQNLNHWYRISNESIYLVAHLTPIIQYGLINMLKEAYPHHPWKDSKSTSPFKAAQRILTLKIQEIFRDSEVIEDYLHPEMVHSSGQNMSLDVFLSNKSLALEYHGRQHFVDIFTMGPQWRYSERDKEKRTQCQLKGITLIEIPYWWDFSRESLSATIHNIRPDLIDKTDHLPIPSLPPKEIKKEPYNTPSPLGESEVRLLSILPTGFRCQQSNGVEVTVPAFQYQLKSPPDIGSILIAQHSGYYSNGTIQEPYFWQTKQHSIVEKDWQQKFFEILAKKLDIQDMEDWYKVKHEDIERYGGSSMLAKSFGNSLYMALMTIFPNYPWLSWRFGRVPSKFYSRDLEDKIRSYIDWLELKLKILEPKEWYRVSVKHMRSVVPVTVLKYKSLAQLLASKYPNYRWKVSKLAGEKRI